MSIFVAIVSLYVIRVLVSAFNMRLMTAIMDMVLDVGMIALIIIFQPEIRKFLMRLGSKYMNSRQGKAILDWLIEDMDRSGVIDENGNDTGVDPFMRSMPGLIDVGIMQTCVCSHRCNVDCYQKAIDRRGPNMSVEDFELILKQCEGKTFQLALGGAGDVDTHENFEAILKLCRQYGIVPNFTRQSSNGFSSR